MKYFRKIFLTGLLSLLPLGITVYLLYWLVSSLDSLLKEIILSFTDFYIPGLGFLSAVLLIFAAGLFASNVLGKWFLRQLEKILSKVPIVNTIYGSVADIQKTFANNPSKRFSKVVLIDYPLKGTKSMGFIASDEVLLNENKKVSVFVPTTPNPTNGFLLFLNHDDIEILDLPVDSAIKMIVSMGTYQPKSVTPK